MAKEIYKVTVPLWKDIKPETDLPILEDELLTPGEVKKLFRLGPTEFFRKVHSGQFPPPIIMSERCRRWRKSHVEHYTAWHETNCPVVVNGEV